MIAAGFANPVPDAQAAFRAIMAAAARPGRVVPVAGVAGTPKPLLPASAAIVLSLVDHDSPVWLDEAAADAVSWIRFHTGAPVVADAREASFAIVTRPQAMPKLADFNPGTPDYPDRSTTVIVQVGTLTSGTPLTLAGPGIRERQAFAPAPCPAGLVEQLALNRAIFPQGIDLVFAGDNDIAALPRSVRVVEND